MVLHLALESLSRIIHRSVGRYPLNPKHKRAQEVTHAETAGATTGRGTRQETRFHPYPEWRKRMLQKCIASGRYGVLASPAKPRPDTGAYELPRELQQLWENEEVASQPESMMSDAEWEGWRRELESAQPGLREPSFVTESDGLLRRMRREDSPVLGRGNVFEEIIKRTTEQLGQPSGVLRPGVFVDIPAACGARSSTAAHRPSPLSNSAPTSPRQSFSVAKRGRSATLATSTAPRPSSHYTRDANSDLATLFPNPPDAPTDRRLPGLGGGLGSYRPHTHTVTTISVRGAGNEAAPKKSVEKIWSNEGTRRSETEDNLTSEEAIVERPSLTDDYRDGSWARSHNEGLDRLRYMSSSGLRQTSSKGGLFKSFSLRDR